MIHLITYGDNKYTNSKIRLYNEAKSTGWFDNITLYGQEDLDSNFKEKFKNILQQKKGGGYWIWKPYIIKKHLEKINDNDILIYLDAGCTINSNGQNRFNEYIKLLNNSDEGCISFQMHHIEKLWTIKEIFQYFKIETNEKIIDSGQIMATIIIIKKNINSIKLINLWNETLHNNSLLFTDYYNKSQDTLFQDNRHDQSIFSIIRKISHLNHEGDLNPILLNDETWFEQFRNTQSLKYPFWATRKN